MTIVTAPLPSNNAGPPYEGRMMLLPSGEVVYAQGADYHDLIKKALKALARWLVEESPCDLKVFVDTAPVMEKPLAQAAGLGWQGKHTNLVSREFGSWLFLGAIFTSLDLPRDDALAERADLRLGLWHEPGDAAADGGAVRHAREAERAAQGRVPREQLVQLRVAEGARRDGDDGQQQEREAGEVAPLAAPRRAACRRPVSPPASSARLPASRSRCAGRPALASVTRVGRAWPARRPRPKRPAPRASQNK